MVVDAVCAVSAVSAVSASHSAEAIESDVKTFGKNGCYDLCNLQLALATYCSVHGEQGHFGLVLCLT